MKNFRIEEMRGVACILVVMFHAVSSEAVLSGTVLAYFTQSLIFVRMPLFIAITGYLYGNQRSQRRMTPQGWSRRVGRLLPHFLGASIVCCSIDLVAGRGFHIGDAMIFGTWHLWYLQSLAVLLAIACMLDMTGWMSKHHLWIVAGVGFILSASGLFADIRLFSINRAVSLLPFFYAGAAIAAVGLPDRRYLMAIYLAGGIGMTMHLLSMVGLGPIWGRSSLVAAAIGLTGFVLIGQLMPSSLLFQRLGAYSLPIYLWHLPVSALASAVVFNHVDLNPYVEIVLRLALGVTIPAVICRMAGRKMPVMLTVIGRRSAGRAVPIATARDDLVPAMGGNVIPMPNWEQTRAGDLARAA